MIIVGELINSTREKIRKAVAERNSAFVMDIARQQEAAGATYLDVNAGAFAEAELENLEWMVKTVREASALPLCIDSPIPQALAHGCVVAGGRAELINSISGEKERFRAVLPIVKEHNTNVVALAMDDAGLLEDEEAIYAVACRLVESLLSEGIAAERIFLDPLVRPIGTNSAYGNLTLNILRRITAQYPDIHKICGLSNVSFGLPKRKIINRAFLVLAMASGLDAAILDPLDKPLMALLKGAEALLGRDDYCMNYIAAARSGEFEQLE